MRKNRIFKKRHKEQKMTFEEVNRLLREYKSNKKLLDAEQRRIQELRASITDLRATDYSRENVCKSREPSAYMESILDRIARLERRANTLIQNIFDIEDMIADNMDNLTPLEQAIVIDRYMNCWSLTKICKKYNYCERQVRRIIVTAKRKMTK